VRADVPQLYPPLRDEHRNVSPEPYRFPFFPNRPPSHESKRVFSRVFFSFYEFSDMVSLLGFFFPLVFPDDLFFIALTTMFFLPD